MCASKTLMASKRTDKLTNVEKSKAWEEVAMNFNSQGKNIPRTVSQLKKLWENIKFRQKGELAEERRKLIRTGGGPFIPSSYEQDPELEAMGGVDIEIKDVIDNESAVIGMYNMNTEGVLIPVPEAESKPENQEAKRIPTTHEFEADIPVQKEQAKEIPTPYKCKTYPEFVKKEGELRVLRARKQIQNDDELHAIRVQEAHLKLSLLERELSLKNEVAKRKLKVLELKEELLLKELNK